MTLLSVLLLSVMVPVVIYTELKDGKIYNWLTIPALSAGLILAFAEHRLGDSVRGMLIGGGLFFFPYVLSGLTRNRPVIGGGDVKLAAALGAIMGLGLCLLTLYYAVLYGAAIGIGALLWRGMQRWKERRRGSEGMEAEGDEAEKAPAASRPLLMMRIPFGTAICLAITTVIFMSI